MYKNKKKLFIFMLLLSAISIFPVVYIVRGFLGPNQDDNWFSIAIFIVIIVVPLTVLSNLLMYLDLRKEKLRTSVK